MTRPVLPGWAADLRDRYLSGEASLFLVHGNVRDLHPWRVDGGVEYLTLRAFLERFLARIRALLASVEKSFEAAFDWPDRSDAMQASNGENDQQDTPNMTPTSLENETHIRTTNEPDPVKSNRWHRDRKETLSVPSS